MTAGQMMRSAGLGLALAWAALAGPAAAQGNPVVVEFYTSQGCVSCPPADADFARLVQEPGVIALALHVDYWDYLGWADVFADPAFTARQKRYARAAGDRMIYTPQMIVGGADRVQGARPAELRSAIAARAAQPAPVTLQVTRGPAGLQIEAMAATPLGRPAVVQLVRYHPQETVMIERGENAGQQITYHNIVTSWNALAEWTGEAPLRLQASADGDDAVVVIVQEAGPGPVLAAARLD